MTTLTAATLTDELVAGAEAVAAGTPKIEPVEAQFEKTAGQRSKTRSPLPRNEFTLAI